MKKMLLTCVFSAFFTSFVCAADMQISNIYIKETPPNAKNTAIFLTIHNNSSEDRKLLRATSNASSHLELHTHIHQGGKMQMQELPHFLIKANSTLELSPGSFHIMVFDTQKIDANSKIDLELVFDNDEVIKLENIPVGSALEPMNTHHQRHH